MLDYRPIKIQHIDYEHLNDKGICLDILRADHVHPTLSGNKLFKLKPFLEYAEKESISNIITYGGPYSNHLTAAAFSCRKKNRKVIGVIRGEKPETLSHTLQFCVQEGMTLKFASRENYRNQKSPAELVEIVEGEQYLHIPEGGYHPLGSIGSAEMIADIPPGAYSHICVAVGTATTFAGLISGNQNRANTILGFQSLKGMTDIHDRLHYLTGKQQSEGYQIIDDYHFGGYAKYSQGLFDFMNDMYQKNNIPLDFVYTGKMLFGIMDLIKKNYFSPGSRILCIHTGGLQGNVSLPGGTLCF